VVKKWWASNYYIKNRQAKRKRCMSKTKNITCKAPKLGTRTRNGKIHSWAGGYRDSLLETAREAPTIRLAPMCPKLSAIDVTAEAIFEPFYLVSYWELIGKICHHTLGAHTPTDHSMAICRFLCKFFSGVLLNFFGQHDSPSNVAESCCFSWASPSIVCLFVCLLL